MTEYKDRLKPLMDAKKLDITQLARELGISYQAVRKVFKEGGAFGPTNNRKAAKFFGVDPTWLEGGDALVSLVQAVKEQSAMTDKPAFKPQTDSPALDPGSASASGMEIALLYDLIPIADRVRRVKAYNAATKAILAVLEEQPPIAAAAVDSGK